jgi:hypothetical protein
MPPWHYAVGWRTDGRSSKPHAHARGQHITTAGRRGESWYLDLGASFDGRPLCLYEVKVKVKPQATGTVCGTASPTPLLWIIGRSWCQWSEKKTQIGSIVPCTHTGQRGEKGQYDADCASWVEWK